jgi:Glycosyltransferase family 87
MRHFTFKRLGFAIAIGQLILHLVMAWNARDMVKAGYPDFTIFYTAGKIVGTGQSSKLYDGPTQFATQRAFAAVSVRQGPLPYNHPPFEALLFTPLAWLSYLNAYLIWDVLNLAILAGLAFVLRPHFSWFGPLMWTMFALAFFPVFVVLLQGQDTLLLALLLGLAFSSFRREAHLAAGCWLGLGLFRFHLLLPMLLLLVVQKRWKTLLGFGLVAAVLAGFSVATVGWASTMAYPSYVLHTEEVMRNRQTLIEPGMPNLFGFLTGVLGPWLGRTAVLVIVAATSLAVLVVSALRWRPAGGGLFELQFSLAVVAGILVSYHSLPGDLSLLLIPATVVAWRYRNGLTLTGFARLVLIGAGLVLLFSPLHVWLAFRQLRYSLMMLPLLGLWWVLWRLVKRSAPDPGSGGE